MKNKNSKTVFWSYKGYVYPQISSVFVLRTQEVLIILSDEEGNYFGIPESKARRIGHDQFVSSLEDLIE